MVIVRFYSIYDQFTCDNIAPLIMLLLLAVIDLMFTIPWYGPTLKINQWQHSDYAGA